MSHARQRRWMVWMIAFMLIGCWTMSAHADIVTQRAKGTPLKKMGRGVVNIATGVLEIPRAASLAAQEGIQAGEYPFTAYPEGLLKGIIPGTVKALGRTGSGAYDMLTFPVEMPANYGALYQPPTIFAPDHWTAPKPARAPQ